MWRTSLESSCLFLSTSTSGKKKTTTTTTRKSEFNGMIFKKTKLKTKPKTKPKALVLVDSPEHNADLVRGKRAIELGSGTGLVGLAAASLGAHRVYLTDMQSMLPI